MAVIVSTLIRPHRGKRPMAENRARQLGGIVARHGASVKVASVSAGANAGSIVLLREYPDFRTAAKVFQAINNDPVHIEFWRETEANPSADIVTARNLMRVCFGENKWSTHSLSLIRQYELARNKIGDALKLLPEVATLVSKADVNVVGILPVLGENLSSLSISYQFRSMDHWGEAMDSVGVSAEFQAIVAKAAEFGTLRSSFTLNPL